MESVLLRSIWKLADELHRKEVLLRNSQISELAYTEDCLWISLEAMIKLIASAASMFCAQQAAEFGQALVTRFIESQHRLDEELEKQYAAYRSELDAQSKQFYTLIEHAFAPDFRTAFLHSILLADASGVKKSEILSSTEDIAFFFLG